MEDIIAAKRKLIELVASWLNQKGRRHSIEDITSAESKVLQIGHIMAELKVHRFGFIMSESKKPSKLNIRLRLRRMKDSPTGPHHG